MIKKWEIKASPAPRFPDRKLLLMSSEGKDDAAKLKKSFAGYVGVVFSSDNADFQWAAYLYGASANIEKLINQELKELSAESPAEKKMEFPKRAPKPEGKESAAKSSPVTEKPAEVTPKKADAAVSEKEEESAGPVIEQFEKSSTPAKTEQAAPASPVIEKFEQFTPDQSSAKPLTAPLVETFAARTAASSAADEKAAPQEEAPAEPAKESVDEEKEVTPARKDAKPIDVLYLCPESARDKADIVKENIAKIVAEKNINFEFKSVGVVSYKTGAGKESVMEEIAGYKFSFVLIVAPDAMGEELLREIKKKGYVPKVIAEDNIDKKFRYLNLITDIVLSPRR